MASSKRERELARLRAERQAARRAAEAARRRQRYTIGATALIVLLVIAGFWLLTSALGSGSKKATAAASPSSSASSSASASAAPSAGPPGTCTYTKTKQPAARPVPLPPGTGVETSRTFTIRMVTNRGEIDFDTLTAQAPCTSNSFRSLIHFGFYNNTPCHRLTSGALAVLQCGDPSGKGSGGPGYQFGDENLKGATYPRGTVAMANAGPGTNGSQFFLVYQNSQLPPNYTPFGVITKGLDVLDRIAAGGIAPGGNAPNDGAPKLPVEIISMRAVPKG